MAGVTDCGATRPRRDVMANENPAPDDAPAPDLFEAELVAYLDGELDPVSARKVERNWRRIPAARPGGGVEEVVRHARLPSAPGAFADVRHPHARQTPGDEADCQWRGVGPARRHCHPTTRVSKRPTEHQVRADGVSTSMPIPLDDDEPSEPRQTAPRRFLWAAALVAAVSTFATLGYFATAAVRPHLFHTRDKDGDEARIDVEPRVIEHLPLYAVVDDLAFVTELARPDFFGEDSAVAFDTTLKVPAVEPADKPTGKHNEALVKSFRALPPARQAEIVKLDHDLAAKDPRERERLFRVLEAYAVWLECLPEAERRGVLTAATPGLRLDVIRKIRDQQWRESLPPPLRGNQDAIQQWKDEEAIRRERWAFIRQHAEAFAANKSPWPFDTEAGKTAVIDYAHDVLKVDDTKRCRLLPEELAEYKRTLVMAQRDGAWAWYGLMVYELASHHPYLPEPADPKQMFSDISDLPEPFRGSSRSPSAAS